MKWIICSALLCRFLLQGTALSVGSTCKTVCSPLPPQNKNYKVSLVNVTASANTLKYILNGDNCVDVMSLSSLLQGPVFIQEPPAALDFANSTGTVLGCSAHGNPPPDITWLDAAGHEVPALSRLREVLNNGSLYFPPFPPEEYSPEVHAASYRCRASNPVGIIVSRECRLRADVSQAYQLQVHNVFVVRGNVAVLRCTVPGFVRGLVVVSAWMREDPLLGRTPIHIGGRFTVTSSGSLHVRDVQPEDGYSRFVCQAVHKLTGERRLSLPGQIIVTEPEGNMAPRIEHSASNIHAQSGFPVDLVCVARGYPPPSYRWYREAGGSLQEVTSMTVPRPLHSVHQLPRAQPSDSGRYVCVTHNPLGEDRREVTLTISSPLSAYIRPQHQTADAGAVASFNCSIGGGGEGTEGAAPREISWMKDGRAVVPGGRVSVTEGGHVLSVHGVSRNDRGMYQCQVRAGEDNAQGSAELSLGAVAPELHSTFIAQTLQPGPAVSLRCGASGSPPPRISWQLDGAELGGSASLMLGSYLAQGGDVISHLNVTTVRVHHGGLYTCVATNTAGSTSYSAPLNVYGPPSARPPRNMTVVAGTDVFLRCPVAGFPISSVTWRRGEAPLPAHLRQRVFPNGTLVIRGVEGGTDSGQYSCVASNTQGQSAQSSLGLDVMKPPEIAPFQFPTNLKEGMRAQVSCSIISGDFPIAISWRKDGAMLSPEPDVAEQQHQFVSNLLFMNLAARHSGQYTCIASNAAATANLTARLVVRVAPVWDIEPKDTSVLFQNSVALHCQATGFPLPVSTWLRSRAGAPSEDYMPLLPGPRLFLANNGSVVIHSADSSHQGHYMCQSNNGIGPGLSKSIFLRVNVPAHFATRSMNQSAVAGESAVLACPAQGDSPLRVSWVSGPRSLSSAQVREVATPGGGIAAELHLTALTRRDAGPYRCVASNEFGQDELVLHLHVKEPPEAPARVSLLETGSRSLTLGWSAPYSGHTAISHYLVQYREQLATLPASNVLPTSPDSAWHNVTAGGGARSARIAALRPATAYLLRVVAVNEVGPGPPSHPPLLAVTTQEAPSGPPADVTAAASSPEILHVRWKPPMMVYSHGDILGYQVSYREIGGAAESTLQTRRVRGRNRLEVTLTGLRQFTRYQVTVRAFNRVGHGPSSSPLVVTTEQGVPDAPPVNMRCSALSSQSLRVRWDPPPAERRNGILEGYKVFYQLISSASAGSGSSEVEVKKTTNLETNLHGLAHFANYSLRIAAYTGAGDGERSTPIFCTTEEDVPGPPEHIKALVMTSESVMITWSRPVRPNGVIIKYNVYINPLQQVAPKEIVKEVVFGDRELTFEVRRLKEFTRYEFWVTACTAVGEGQPSSKVSQSPISRVPARVASFARRFVVASGQPLTLPCLAVGLPAPERSWRALGRAIGASDSPNTRILPDGSLSLTNVRSSDRGNYTCIAENIYGRDEVHFELAVQVAPGPPVLNVLGPASHSLALQWRLPDDGGSPVSGFTLTYRRDGGEWQQITLDADRRSLTLDRLSCGSPYILQIAASNTVGRGRPSPALSVATKGAAPRVPTQEEFLEVNSTCATLFLDAWPSAGCPITHFVVEVREARTGASWSLVSNRVPPSQPELTLRDLQPARWYAVRVAAQSDAGVTQHEFLFATRNLAGEVVSPELEPERPGPQQGVSLTDPTVIVPIISGIICTAAAAVCVCIVIRRRQYQGYQQSTSTASVTAEQNRYSGKVSLMEAENRRNSDQQQQHRNNHHSNQLYSPSPARKGADSSLSCQKGSDTTSAQDYEICPYATFSLNPAQNSTNNGQQTMDYSMQFQTFSQQECYAGQPAAPTLPMPPASGAPPSYGAKPGSSKEYYSRVRRKSNGSRLTVASPGASEATSFSVAKRTSKSPPDGLSLEISCISSQQTLPLSGPTGISNSAGGGRNARHRHSPPPPGRPRSCPMGDGADSDSSASRANGGNGNYSSRPPYHLPSQAKHGHSSKDLAFEADSSTESAEASPEVTHRSRRKGAPTSGLRRPSGSSHEGLPALQPPSGFSDHQELSEAECDRAERRAHRNGINNNMPAAGLPLFRHEQLEQELASLVKRYRQERDREKQDYTIHV